MDPIENTDRPEAGTKSFAEGDYTTRDPEADALTTDATAADKDEELDEALEDAKDMVNEDRDEEAEDEEDS